MNCGDFCKGISKKFQNGLNAATSTDRLRHWRQFWDKSGNRAQVKPGPPWEVTTAPVFITYISHKQQTTICSNVKVPLFLTTEANSCCLKGRSHFKHPRTSHLLSGSRAEKKGPLHQSSPTLPQGLTFHRYVPAFAIVHCFPSSAPDSSFSVNKAWSNSNRNYYFFQGRKIHRNYGNGENQTKDTARFVLFYFGLRGTSWVKVRTKR